jgi:hypothetical protein
MLNRKRTPLDGKRFGAYTVKHLSETKHRYWVCECDCGTVREIWHTNLTRGLSKSCGCLKGALITAAKTTHAMSGTPFYAIWGRMITRCSNPNIERYKDYGGRGITVCERWLKFENFYEDMWPTWQEGLSIERKEVNGNYEKSNCIWIPVLDQALNKTTSRKIETPWGTICLSVAARHANLSRTTLRYRVNNWPKERWFEPIGETLK